LFELKGQNMKCTLCNQRKGKRFCPAKGDSICAQCCGEKRILEIDCPESCQYLKLGRSHEIDEYARYLGNIDRVRREEHRRVLSEHQDVVAHLESLLAQERRETRDLLDKEVAEAVNLLLAACETEEKGILYERTADDLRVESLRRQLRKVIEAHRNPEAGRGEGIIGAHENRLTLKGAIGCLEFIRDMIASHMTLAKTPSSYVDLLARIIPREQRSERAAGSIIIP
jgi:hypothetical protein